MLLFVSITKEAFDRLFADDTGKRLIDDLVPNCIEVRYVKKHQRYLFWAHGPLRSVAEHLDITLNRLSESPDNYRLIYQSELDVPPEVSVGRLNGAPFYLGIHYKIDYILSGTDILDRQDGRSKKTVVRWAQ